MTREGIKLGLIGVYGASPYHDQGVAFVMRVLASEVAPKVERLVGKSEAERVQAEDVERFVPLREAAAAVGYKVKTLRRAIKGGRLRAWSTKPRVVFELEEVRRWAFEQRKRGMSTKCPRSRPPTLAAVQGIPTLSAPNQIHLNP